MNREEFAARIHWSRVVWFGGLINVVAMMPQLYSLLTTHETAGLSASMFGIFLVMQSTFALQGYFSRSRAQMITMALSAVETTVIIILILHYR